MAAAKAKVVGYLVINNGSVMGRGSSADKAVSDTENNSSYDVNEIIEQINDNSDWELLEIRRSLTINISPTKVEPEDLEEADFNSN